jgi:hypothetical protein
MIRDPGYDELVELVPVPARALLRSENDAFNDFLDLKVRNEEIPNEADSNVWDSLNKQQTEHFSLLEEIIRGERIITQQPDNESELQKAYDELITFVSGRSIDGTHFTINAKGIRETELAWIKYRDAFIALLKVLRPEISSNNVRRFLNTQRIGNLAGIQRE